MALTLSGTNGVVGAGFTVDNSGVSVTAGVGTFGSIGAGTSVAAAGLHGTMPTIDGHALTSINAAQIVGVCTSGLTKTGGFGKVLKVQQTTIPTISSYAAASTTYQTITEDPFVVAGTNSNILVTLNIAGHTSNSAADRNFRLGYKVASGSYTQINFNPNGSISENMFSDIRGDDRAYEFALSTSFLIDGTWNAGDTITFKLSTVGESTFYHNGAVSAADVRFGNGVSKFIFTEYSD